MENNRHIDVLRAFAIIQVLLVHILNQSYFSDGILIKLIFGNLFQIVSCGVPLFIFISGYTLSLKYWKKFSLLEFYKKRLKNVVIPYISFAVVYIIIYIFSVKNIDLTDPTFFYEIFLYILFRPDKIFFHFWFIGLIITFYLIYPLLIKFIRKYQNKKLRILIISIILQAIWIPIRNLLFIIFSSISEYFLIYNILYSLVFYSVLSYISYFVLGIYLSRVKLKSHHYWLLIFPILVLNFISFLFTIRYGYFLEIIFPLIFIPLIIIYFKLSKKIKKIKPILVLFGKYSFSIYLIHGVINLKMIGILYNNSITINNWIFYPLLFILTFSTSYYLAFSINLIPGSQYVIGKIRTERNIEKINQESIVHEI